MRRGAATPSRCWKREHARGATLVDLLVGSALALLVLAATLAGMASGGHALAAIARRAAADEAVVLVTDALRFDVRRAGFDPAAIGVERVVAASPESLTLEADVDADGRIDDRSTEHVRWACRRGTRNLQREIGHQSMPLVENLAACAFDYLDADGRSLTGTLDDGARRAVRVVVLELGLAGAAAPRLHRVSVALRTRP
jgi:Tfp pilus assembly protein PilW